MAKEQLAETGWITFTGLRFVEKLATRKEIILAIRSFFNRRGLSFGELEVQFRVDRRRLPDDALGDYTERVIRIFVRMIGKLPWGLCRNPRNCFFTAIFHEMDHMAWEFEGRPFNYDLPYDQRPHEIRAREVGKEETALFLKGLQQVLPVTK